MAGVSTYLNFSDKTEEAFTFYRSVFGGDFNGGILRMSDAPAGGPPLSEADKKLVMHVELPITGGHLLRGSDCPGPMAQKLVTGTNVYINLEPDTKAEGDRLFKALSVGGKVEMPMQDMFWGDYFGALVDKFGVQWMINVSAKS